MHPRNLNATVSGSFRRAMSEVERAVHHLTDAGVFVLSPADPRIVDQFGDFVFVASDQVRHLRTVQGRHLAAIAASDFLWLVAPEGYIGQSAAMEIGFAAARGTAVYSKDVPTDLTLRQWVTVVSNIEEAIRRVQPGAVTTTATSNVLIDPIVAIQASHDDLMIVERGLVGAPPPADTDAAEVAIRRLRTRLVLP